MNIMDDRNTAYTVSGNYMADKKRLAHYCNGKYSLYIESNFSDQFTIKELIKGYLLNESHKKIKVDTIRHKNYNDGSNEAVVTSEKEGNE